MLLSESRANLFDSFKADSPGDEFSKPKKCLKSGSSPQKSLNMVILQDENDDDDERLARRKSRLLEPHPASVNSPGANSTAARRRADAAAPRGIPQAQIGEHYGNCIRLAAENKITAKNAFNLHLIDYMSEMIKKEDFASFQIASSSLDAGAKIYAGRVDAVHQETYQVLTGLGRSGNPQNEDNESNADNVDDDDKTHSHSKPEQKKKTAAHRDIIHKQLNKIRIKTLADKIDVDPLFQHQTAAYDEGGTAELRLNQLSTANASCELILDSSTPVMLRTLTTTQPITPMNVTNVTEFLSSMLARSLNQLSICSTLQNFRFTDWDLNKNSFDSNSQMNWDANSQPISLLNQDNNDDGDDNGFNPFPVQDDSFCDNIHEDINLDPVFETGVQVEVNGSSAEAVNNNIRSDNLLANIPVTENTTATNTNTTTTTADGELFVSCLKNMLDKQYEHFGKLNDYLLGMWAGPEHWRKKAKRPKLDGAVKLNEDNPEKNFEHESGENEMGIVDKVIISRKMTKSKRDKAQRISYAETIKPSENRTRSGRLSRRDWLKNVLSSGVENSTASNSTIFKETYRQKANRQMNMLPSEWSDSRQTLYQLVNRDVILRPNILLDGRNLTNCNNITSENADYMVGTNELCAVLNVGSADRPVDNEYEDADGGLDQLRNHQDDDDDDDDAIIPFECAFTQNAGYNDGELTDMELISQPNKVARIEIGYARTAKMINVQRLKCAMWGFLEHTVPHVGLNIPSQSPLSVASTTSAPDANSLVDDQTSLNVNENQQQYPMNEDVIESDSGRTSYLPKVHGARGFSEVIDNLSGRISWQMAKELSISIALNCLLHLSNEKQLYLENVDSFSDIYISQGLPSFELKHLETYTNTCDNGDIISGTKSKSNNQKRNKTQHMRPSTLDSWLIEND
uniref:Condensin complex subunit 2 n=1 Tax=Schistosoma mansoni TaxID=6183 RepID=A0A3Q0KR22_SCHMA